jgi:hypothetical protein
MISETMETPPAPAQKEHAVFFRQSGWLMVATIGGGFMSLGIHFLSKRVESTQYGNLRDSADGGHVSAHDSVADVVDAADS